MKKPFKKNVLLGILGAGCIFCGSFSVVELQKNNHAGKAEDEPSYVCKNLLMQNGASVRFTEGTTGLRFTGMVNAEYYDAITDDTTTFGMVIAPRDFFDEIPVGSDYISEMSGHPVQPIVLESKPFKVNENDGYYLIQGSVANIFYSNSNREFVGIAYVRTGEAGGYSYQYADLGGLYDSNTRTVTEVAVRAWNDEDGNYSDAQKAILEGFITKGINQAIGVEESQADEKPTIDFDLGLEDKYAFDETVVISPVFTANETQIGGIGLEAVYSSSDESIIKIVDNRLIFQKEGTATVTGTFAGIEKSQEITVTAGILKDKSAYVDFTDEANLSKWVFSNGNDDPDVSITYGNAIADENGRKQSGFTYHRSLNNGTIFPKQVRNTSYVYLGANIVNSARAYGYSYIAFRVLAQDWNAVSIAPSGYATGDWLKKSSRTKWDYQYISLDAIRANCGIGFYTYAQDLKLADVKFIGADISEDVADVIAGNLAEESLAKKAILASSKSMASLVYANDTVAYTRNANAITWDKGNPAEDVIYINAEWIQAAKQAGFTRLVFTAKASASSAYKIYRQAFTNATSTANLLKDGSFTTSESVISISLADFVAGDKLVIFANTANGQTITFSDIYFKGEEVLPDSVVLDQNSIQLANGASITLTATVLPANAENKSVEWTSSDSTVATVANGVITALKAGTTTITVKTLAGEYSATCSVEVVDVSLPKYVAVGQECDLGNYGYEITSGNENASIANGKLTGVKDGNITVSVLGASIPVRVVDFETLDLASDASFWKVASGKQFAPVVITENVPTGKTSALKLDKGFDNDTSRLTNMLCLDLDLLTCAKNAGYESINFSMNITAATNTTFILMNATETCAQASDGGSTNVFYNPGGNNGGKWVSLSQSILTVGSSTAGLHAGRTIGFAITGQILYLADVKFEKPTSVDLDKSQYIKESSTAGKSVDLVDPDLVGTMFLVAGEDGAKIEYKNDVDTGKESDIGGGDYYHITKTTDSAYVYISSDWIQYAKSQGYKYVAIYIRSCGTVAGKYVKLSQRNADGSVIKETGTNLSLKGSNDAYGFLGSNHENIKIDISAFEEGQIYAIRTTSTDGFDITGITLRK